MPVATEQSSIALREGGSREDMRPQPRSTRTAVKRSGNPNEAQLSNSSEVRVPTTRSQTRATKADEKINQDFLGTGTVSAKEARRSGYKGKYNERFHTGLYRF